MLEKDLVRRVGVEGGVFEVGGKRGLMLIVVFCGILSMGLRMLCVRTRSRIVR